MNNFLNLKNKKKQNNNLARIFYFKNLIRNKRIFNQYNHQNLINFLNQKIEKRR